MLSLLMVLADASEVMLVTTLCGTAPPGVVNAGRWSVQWITRPGTANVRMATPASKTCGARKHRIGLVSVQRWNARWNSQQVFQVVIASADLASTVI